MNTFVGLAVIGHQPAFAIATNPHGDVLASVTGRAIPVHTMDEGHIGRYLWDMFRALADAAGIPHHELIPASSVSLALSACHFSYEREVALPNVLRDDSLTFAKTSLLADVDALELAFFDTPPGLIVLIHDTVTILVSSSSSRATSVGWGPLVEDTGGAYSLGRSALFELHRALDANAAIVASEFFRAVIGVLECDPQWAWLRRRLDGSAKDILPSYLNRLTRSTDRWRTAVCGISEAVVSAAERGDPIAGKIVRSAAQRIAERATAIAANLSLDLTTIQTVLAVTQQIARPLFANAVAEAIGLQRPPVPIAGIRTSAECALGALRHSLLSYGRPITSTLLRAKFNAHRRNIAGRLPYGAGEQP